MLVSVRQVEVWQAVDVITGAVVIGVGIVRLGATSERSTSLAFAVALVLGAVILYCFWLVLATCAFWIVRMGTCRSSSTAST